MPYNSLPLQPVKRDPPGQEGLPTGLPVNIANGAINIDMGRMASGVAAGLQNPATQVLYFFFREGEDIGLSIALVPKVL